MTTNKDDFPSTKADKFIVRLPDGMRDRIKEAADRNKRSMNAEVIHMLEWYFEDMDRLESQHAEQLAFEEEMRENPPENQDALDQLQEEFAKAQGELFRKLAKKHGLVFRSLLPDGDEG